MKRRLLVTGGAGFIGTHFVEHCLRHGLVDRLVVVDALPCAGNRRHLDGVCCGLSSRAFAALAGFRETMPLDEGLERTIRHEQSLT